MTIQISITVPRDTNETARVTMKPVPPKTGSDVVTEVTSGNSFAFPADENVFVTVEMVRRENDGE